MSNNDKATPKIGSLHYILHYIWHFEMVTPINLGSHFFIFWGIAKESHGSSSCLAVAFTTTAR